jgi:hypothetical protein
MKRVLTCFGVLLLAVVLAGCEGSTSSADSATITPGPPPDLAGPMLEHKKLMSKARPTRRRPGPPPSLARP